MPFKRAPGWKIYQDQMSQLNHGDALWQPAPLNYFKRVQLGDVGYVRRGCFHLLFSAGKPLGERQLGVDVPFTFQPLYVGPIVNPQPRLPGCLSTNTVRETGANLGTSMCTVPMLEPGCSISFELSEKQGAALLTKYSTYGEDAQREKAFEEYTKRHYDSWVTFVREGRYGDDVRPVLVSGVDMTRDFAMMAYLNNDVRLKSEFTASIPGVASVSASAWGTWRTEGLVHTNCGPQLCLPPASTQTTDLTFSGVSHTELISEEYNQCVFVRYYTMRKRPLLVPKLIKAGAGPHDLGSGDRDNEEPPLEVQYDSDSDEAMLSDGDEDDGESSFTRTDSDPDAVSHNTTSEEGNDFDVIADYIFQNSDADSVLVHHRDIALLRKTGGSNNTLTQLLEKQPQLIVDGKGVGRIQHGTNHSTRILLNDLIDAAQTTHLGPVNDLILSPDPSGSGTPDESSMTSSHRTSTPPSPQNGVCIPQRRYKRSDRRPLYNQNPVSFLLEDGSYLPVDTALREKYTGLIDRDAPVLGEAGMTITLRFGWPGYPPADYQLRTIDWSVLPKKIPRSKLATEVAKIVNKLVKEMEHVDIEPNESQWRVGLKGIKIQDLRLGPLEQVSGGSWQVQLFYKPSTKPGNLMLNY